MTHPRTFPHVVLVSSSLAAFLLYLLKRRARENAARLCNRVKDTVHQGPLIDANNNDTRREILQRSMTDSLPFQEINNANPLACQVGGISETKRPVLAVSPHRVLKPLHVDHRGYREVAFYEAVQPSRNKSSLVGQEIVGCSDARIRLNHGVTKTMALFFGDAIVQKCEQDVVRYQLQRKKELELLRSLSRIVPTYYGVVGPSSTYVIGKQHHLVLHDITAKFRKPCIIDIKMGSQTYEPDATQEKRCREYGKYPQQKEFGFRIVGMRMYDPLHPDADSTGFRVFRKDFGRTLVCVESLLEAFRWFFGGSSSHNDENDSSKVSSNKLRTRVITNLLNELKLVETWFNENDCLCFYSSSILMVYEGEPNTSDEVAMKMIDFGHVRREYGGDYGYMLGLRNLREIFGLLLGGE